MSALPSPSGLSFPLKDLIDDHFEKLTAEDLKSAHLARAVNIEQIMRVSGKHLDAGTGSIARAADKLDQIAAARGTTSNATVLSSLIQSRVEEAQELQQLVRTSVSFLRYT